MVNWTAIGFYCRGKAANCRLAMQYFFYLRNDIENKKNKTSNEELAFNVVDAVIVFWQMARIKTKTRQTYTNTRVIQN